MKTINKDKAIIEKDKEIRTLYKYVKHLERRLAQKGIQIWGN